LMASLHLEGRPRDTLGHCPPCFSLQIKAYPVKRRQHIMVVVVVIAII
jgi:hypothetical protein